MQAKREQWSGFAEKTEASHLVFLDESGVNINMTRRYGRGNGGQRVADHTPLNTQQSTTILSSIRLDGEMAYTTFQGGTTGDKFLTYLKDVLIPTLRPGINCGFRRRYLKECSKHCCYLICNGDWC